MRREYVFTLDEIKQKLGLAGRVASVNQYMGNTADRNAPDFQKVTSVKINTNEDVEPD